jgi:hypothetical protein
MVKAIILVINNTPQKTYRTCQIHRFLESVTLISVNEFAQNEFAHSSDGL